MMICTPVAALYSEPDLGSEYIDEALYGMSCVILDTVNGFYKVRMFYGYDGYVLKNCVCEQLHEPNMLVTVPFSDLLPEAKNYYGAVLTVPQGSLLDVGFSEQFERYGFVVLPTKRVYYIHKSHIKPLPKPKSSGKTEKELRAGIADSAMTYLGTQYRWGGKTHLGIDCSGFAFMAYYLNGFLIYRDADITKSPNVKKINLSQAKTGDLLYFPGHMAVYLGDGEYIHSSAKAGKVIISSFCQESENYEEFLAKNLLYTGTIF